MALIDQASVLKNAMSLVPDYADTVTTQLLQQRQIQETKQIDLENKLKESAQEDQLAYVDAATRTFANPTAASIAQLQARFPKHHDAVKAAWETKEKAVRESDISGLSNIWGAARSGSWDLAAKWARERYQAEVDAGQADDADRAVVEALESGTPEDQAMVTGLISHQILGALGPEKFATAFESFSEDKERGLLLPSKVSKAESEATTAEAEAASADEYYPARARSEIAQAEVRESNSAWADIKNANQAELTQARKSGIISVIKKRGASIGKAPGKVTPNEITDYLATKGKKSKLTPAELDAWNYYNKTKASGEMREGQTATNGKGQKIIFQGGEWRIFKKPAGR